MFGIRAHFSASRGVFGNFAACERLVMNSRGRNLRSAPTMESLRSECAHQERHPGEKKKHEHQLLEQPFADSLAGSRPYSGGDEGRGQHQDKRVQDRPGQLPRHGVASQGDDLGGQKEDLEDTALDVLVPAPQSAP